MGRDNHRALGIQRVDEVRRYFSEGSNAFLGLYEGQLSPIERLATRLFRQGVSDRFILTMELLGNVAGSRVLDVGCGAGPLSIALAERRANATGIDLAEPMIRKAEAMCEHLPAGARPRFIVGNFMEMDFPTRSFDAVVALGVMDYLADALPFLARMVDLATGHVVASFPGAYRIQNPLRRLYLAGKRCPVYFYTRRAIARLAMQAGLRSWDILPISSGYVLDGMTMTEGERRLHSS